MGPSAMVDQPGGGMDDEQFEEISGKFWIAN